MVSQNSILLPYLDSTSNNPCHQKAEISLVHSRGIDVGGESEPFRVSSTLPPNSITRGIIEHFAWSEDTLVDHFSN